MESSPMSKDEQRSNQVEMGQGAKMKKETKTTIDALILAIEHDGPLLRKLGVDVANPINGRLRILEYIAKNTNACYWKIAAEIGKHSRKYIREETTCDKCENYWKLNHGCDVYQSYGDVFKGCSG